MFIQEINDCEKRVAKATKEMKERVETLFLEFQNWDVAKECGEPQDYSDEELQDHILNSLEYYQEY